MNHGSQGGLSDQLGNTGRKDLYQYVTNQVLKMLEKGVAPWRSTILGHAKLGMPKNLNSGRKYRGINVFLLAMIAYARGYESAYWLTFKQAQERGGNVKKGEHSSVVVFWKQFETTDRETQQKVNIPVLRYYNVFNVQQCEKIEVPDAPQYTPVQFNPIERAEDVVKSYVDRPTIEHVGSRAYYRPSEDVVRIPEPTRFETNEAYYSTLFHELSHSTGHSKRLNRKLDSDPKPFGSPDYGKEELIAEMSAAFLCAHTGITPATIENTASYLSGWMGLLKKDKKLLITAAGAAQRSADYILGIHPDEQARDGEHGEHMHA